MEGGPFFYVPNKIYVCAQIIMEGFFTGLVGGQIADFF